MSSVGYRTASQSKAAREVRRRSVFPVWRKSGLAQVRTGIGQAGSLSTDRGATEACGDGGKELDQLISSQCPGRRACVMVAA